MQSGSRKRVVSSCIPCYRKKQKCNRRYPCNHCTRRRLPENCVYQPSQASQTPQADSQSAEDNMTDNDINSREISGKDEPIGISSYRTIGRSLAAESESDSLAELFAHVEHSECNTMTLVRRLGLNERDEFNGGNGNIPVETFDEIQGVVRKLPDRGIVDFLVQYYVTEVHWMEQVIHAPWFLGQYQKWWTLGQLSMVHHVEFAVLFLRICTYASQFLLSPSYAIDRIRGMPLIDIRNTCHDIAETLATLCERIEARGTLLRVQHLSVLGLQWQCEGRISAFWEVLSKAVRVPQRIGLHRGRAALICALHEFDKEIWCRVYCNLYIWDSLLARQLESNPFLATRLTADHLPRMNLSLNGGDGDGPDSFSERLLQAQLANFWRYAGPRSDTTYEAMEAGERYEKFCVEVLPELPPAFALIEPSRKWDEQLPRLPMQRQVLHTAIFESLCHNFRPVLLVDRGQIQNLPSYKQILITSQRHTLAAAALKVLKSVSNLYVLLGRSHTRFIAVIFPTFEAAVVLGSLIMDTQFPDTSNAGTNPSPNLELETEQNGHVDPLAWDKAHLTRERCWHAVGDALALLEMLTEVSNVAKVGARALVRLMAKIPVLTSTNGGGGSGDVAQTASLDIDSFHGDGAVGQTALLDLDQFLAAFLTDP